MAFAKAVKAYIDAVHITPKALSDTANIPLSTLSRYLSGERTPAANSDVPARLATAIATLSAGQLDEAQVAAELQHALSGSAADPKTFTLHFRTLVDELGISGNRLAHALGFDPSYISRIRSGARHPANMAQFSDRVARYVAHNCTSDAHIATLARLAGVGAQEIASVNAREQTVCAYLGSNAEPEAEPPAAAVPLARFLAALDAFDLNAFLEEIHFADIKVPTVPFQLPTTKSYTGIEEMKQAELDFLRAAVLARSTEDVIFYSDMPLEEMAQDKEFPKQVMKGVALLVRKGVTIRNIHDVYRPIDELFMGLEGWLPVYMVGGMESYYLPAPTNTAFLHFLRSAGTVALTGEAIAGDQGSGRYTLMKSAADVAYCRTRALQLLALAKPLIRVYQESQRNELEAALRHLHSTYGSNTISVGEGEFDTLQIRALPGRYVLLSKTNPPATDFLIEHPALVEALEHYEPTLF